MYQLSSEEKINKKHYADLDLLAAVDGEDVGSGLLGLLTLDKHMCIEIFLLKINLLLNLIGQLSNELL